MKRALSSQGEGGFVLIAAIWLLILAGSITAILMLRSLAGATAAAEHQQSIERRLALDSAIETLLADRLFNGSQSAWAMAPARGVIRIGNRSISLLVTSESGRLDVNAADPALIDSALQGFRVAGSERDRIITRVKALRATRRQIRSLPELAALIGDAAGQGGDCIADSLTWVSGLAEPLPAHMHRDLAAALGGRGGAGGEPTQSMPEPGAALRIEASEAAGAPMIAIVRASGVPEQPTSITVWGAPAPCPPPVAGKS